jgi:hypothetical protein
MMTENILTKEKFEPKKRKTAKQIRKRLHKQRVKARRLQKQQRSKRLTYGI